MIFASSKYQFVIFETFYLNHEYLSLNNVMVPAFLLTLAYCQGLAFLFSRTSPPNSIHGIYSLTMQIIWANKNMIASFIQRSN